MSGEVQGINTIAGSNSHYSSDKQLEVILHLLFQAVVPFFHKTSWCTTTHHYSTGCLKQCDGIFFVSPWMAQHTELNLSFHCIITLCMCFTNITVQNITCNSIKKTQKTQNKTKNKNKKPKTKKNTPPQKKQPKTKKKQKTKHLMLSGGTTSRKYSPILIVLLPVIRGSCTVPQKAPPPLHNIDAVNATECSSKSSETNYG